MDPQSSPSGLVPIPRVPTGRGRIALALHGTKAIFEELSSAYPLKLLSPQVHEAAVGIVYLLSYGGGLVGGDYVELEVALKEGSRLVVLSQGSTKVFKTRPGGRLAAIGNAASICSSGSDAITTQRIRYTLASKSCLLLLPDPVTCFDSASYNQVQTFHIAADASLVVLDWLTSGRKALNEEWAFTRYYSENEIFVEGQRVAKDVMLLLQNEDAGGSLPRRTLGERLGPYSCYATVLLYGVGVKRIVEELAERFGRIRVFKQRTPGEVLWSFSPLCAAGGVVRRPGMEPGLGAVVRVAGKETELVKRWLQEALKGVEDIVGVDAFRKAFV